MREPVAARSRHSCRREHRCGVVRGRRFPSWPSRRTGLRTADAGAVGQEVVTGGQSATSRSPADLPAFCPAITEQFAHAPG